MVVVLPGDPPQSPPLHPPINPRSMKHGVQGPRSPWKGEPLGKSCGLQMVWMKRSGCSKSSDRRLIAAPASSCGGGGQVNSRTGSPGVPGAPIALFTGAGVTRGWRPNAADSWCAARGPSHQAPFCLMPTSTRQQLKCMEAFLSCRSAERRHTRADDHGGGAAALAL